MLQGVQVKQPAPRWKERSRGACVVVVALVSLLISGSTALAAPPNQGGEGSVAPADPAGFIIDYVAAGGGNSAPVTLASSEVTPFHVPGMNPGDPGCPLAGTDWAAEPRAGPTTAGTPLNAIVAKGPHGDYGFTPEQGCYYVAVTRGAVLVFSPIVGGKPGQPVRDLSYCWSYDTWFAGPESAGDASWSQAAAACPAPEEARGLVIDPGPPLPSTLVAVFAIVLILVAPAGLTAYWRLWRCLRGRLQKAGRVAIVEEDKPPASGSEG